MTTAIDRHVESLLFTKGELEGQLVTINAMLDAAGVKRTRRKAAAAKPGASKQKSNNVSEKVMNMVSAVVVRLEQPTGTTDITKLLNDGGFEVSQGLVGKALKKLAEDRIIRFAGFEPGVKGRRPLYAPWPTPDQEEKVEALLDAQPIHVAP